jgi:sporulation protein YlmC with PRC-barrel domain
VKEVPKMRKLKDTGRLTKDINSTITGEILGNNGDLVIIDKRIDKKHLLITDTVTRQTFIIEDSDINIDYPDVSKMNIELLYNEGWTEGELTKHII